MKVKNILGLESIVNDKLDMKVGILKRTYIKYQFNNLYTNKHGPITIDKNNPSLYDQQIVNKFDTYVRYVRRYHGIK